jgi:hypothetical protein
MMVSRFNGKYSKRVSIKVLILIFISIAIAGCLNTVQDSAEDQLDENGRHLAGWIEVHGSYFQDDGSACDSCHGDKLFGGHCKDLLL